MMITKNYLDDEIARIQADINRLTNEINSLIGAREAFKAVLVKLMEEAEWTPDA